MGGFKTGSKKMNGFKKKGKRAFRVRRPANGRVQNGFEKMNGFQRIGKRAARVRFREKGFEPGSKQKDGDMILMNVSHFWPSDP